MATKSAQFGGAPSKNGGDLATGAKAKRPSVVIHSPVIQGPHGYINLHQISPPKTKLKIQMQFLLLSILSCVSAQLFVCPPRPKSKICIGSSYSQCCEAFTSDGYKGCVSLKSNSEVDTFLGVCHNVTADDKVMCALNPSFKSCDLLPQNGTGTASSTIISPSPTSYVDTSILSNSAGYMSAIPALTLASLFSIM